MYLEKEMYTYELKICKLNEKYPNKLRTSQLEVSRLCLIFSVTKFIRTGTADKAENPPFFQQSQYEVDVEENVKLHTSILTVIASSTDPGTCTFSSNTI